MKRQTLTFSFKAPKRRAVELFSNQTNFAPKVVKPKKGKGSFRRSKRVEME